MTAPEEFEARELIVGHKVLWDALVAWADERGIDIVQIPPEVFEKYSSDPDPDALPSYIFSPRRM